MIDGDTVGKKPCVRVPSGLFMPVCDSLLLTASTSRPPTDTKDESLVDVPLGVVAAIDVALVV